jgi:outer membrane murein-binding lipoprotein Lpp
MATEVTLQDIATTLQEVVNKVNNLDGKVNSLDTKVNNLDAKVNNLDQDVKKLTTENERSNDKLTNYQQASQSLVNLAFSLIASATVITVVSAVFKK